MLKKLQGLTGVGGGEVLQIRPDFIEHHLAVREPNGPAYNKIAF